MKLIKKLSKGKKVLATAAATAVVGASTIFGGLFAGCAPKNTQSEQPNTNTTAEDNTTNKFAELEQEIKNLQNQNEQFKSELKDMQGEIDSLKNDIKTLNAKYTEFITNYNALESTVEILRQKAETNGDDISSLQEDISTANGLIATLQANIAELKQLTQNTELAERVAALETMLGNMSLSVYKLQLNNIVDNTFNNQPISCFINQGDINTHYYATSNGNYCYNLGDTTYVVSQDDLVFASNNGEETISSASEETIPYLLKLAINSADNITKTDNGYVCSADENGLKMSVEVLKGKDQIWSVEYQDNETGHVYGRRNNITEAEAQIQIEYYASQIKSCCYYNEVMSNVDEIFNNSYVDVVATMQQSVEGDVVDTQTQRVATSNKHTAAHDTSTRYNTEFYSIKGPNEAECILVEDGKPEKVDNESVVSKSMLHSSLKLSLKQGLTKILYDEEQDEFTLFSKMYDQTAQVKTKKADGHIIIEISYSQFDEDINKTADYTETYDISALTKENFQAFYKEVESTIDEYLSQLETSR